MKRIALGFAATLAGLLVGPNLASALTAVTTEPTNLRAGPAFDFPVVDRIPDDARVTIHGCVRAYRWCDISWRDARGWVPGDELAYFYQRRYVPVIEYGPRIGLPLIIFSFDTYWDRYYRGRPWYGERARWRTVWRDRDGGGRRNADRPRDRREGKAEREIDRRQGDVDRRQSDGRREAKRRQGDDGDRGMDRRSKDEQRSNRREGRGEFRERGEGRALSPGSGRGSERSSGGRPEAGERSGGARGGRDGGGPGEGDRRQN